METNQLMVSLARSARFGLGIEVSGGTDSRRPVRGGRDEGIRVTAVIAGGPADGCLRPGDLILGCNGVSLRQVTHDAAIAHLQRSPVVRLLVERTLDHVRSAPAAAAPATCTNCGDLPAMDDPDGFTVEVTFVVRSTEAAHKSQLVVSKTLDSINGVSVQQLASPAHLARLIDSAQATTLRYVQLGRSLASTSSAKDSGNDSCAGSRAGSVSQDCQHQHQYQHQQQHLARQRSQQDQRLSLTSSCGSQMVPNLKREMSALGLGADLTETHRADEVHLRSSITGAANDRPASLIEASNCKTDVHFKDATTRGGRGPDLNGHGHYEMANGSLFANGVDGFPSAETGRRGGSNGRGLDDHQQRAAGLFLTQKSGKEQQQSRAAEQPKARSVGQVASPVDTQLSQHPRLSQTSQQSRSTVVAPPGTRSAEDQLRAVNQRPAPTTGRPVTVELSMPVGRRNDQSFIHQRRVDRPADSGQQAVGRRPAEQPPAHYRDSQQLSTVEPQLQQQQPLQPPQPPRSPEQIRLVLPDSSGSIGAQLDGGNAVGIFVKSVTPGGPAARAGLRLGDRLLTVDDRSLARATKEEALLTLMRAGDRALKVETAPDPPGYRAHLASRQSGDRFHVRAHFTHTTPAPGESEVRRNDVFLVRDTLAGGVVGSWEAVRVHPAPAETEALLIPCANRADQIVMATAGSELPTAFPPYERVALRRAPFCRPVVVYGPFADLVRAHLVGSLPDRFEQPRQAGPTVKLSAIRAVVGRGKHCVLDLNPVAVDRLCFAQLAPIVLFVRAASRLVVKKVRKEPGSKQLFQESARLERWCSHLFTGVFTVDQPDLSALLAGLDGLIHLQQCQPLWLAEKDERPVRALSEPNLCCSKFSGSDPPDEELSIYSAGQQLRRVSEKADDVCGYHHMCQKNRPVSCGSDELCCYTEDPFDHADGCSQPPQRLVYSTGR